MGRRGPQPRSPELTKLLGNPGRRRLALLNSKAGTSDLVLRRRIAPPDFLDAREREIFRQALELLPPDVLRVSDHWALGRWCSWLSIFIDCKRVLARPENSIEQFPGHASAKLMDRAEARLVALEDRLALSAGARASIMSRLLIAPEPGVADEASLDDDRSSPDAATKEHDDNPLGFVARAGGAKH